MEPPLRFVDTMSEGPFREFFYVHEFIAQENAALMRDTLHWISPLGGLGKLADRIFLFRPLQQFLTTRNSLLKQRAEALVFTLASEHSA